MLHFKFNILDLSTVLNTIAKGFKYLRQRWSLVIGKTSLLISTKQLHDQSQLNISLYAYIIIGADRTTFRANGGDPEFAIAQSIVTIAQSGGERLEKL